MTKVTFLTGEYPPMQGGIADHTAILASHLQSLGVESSVLISRKYENIGGRRSTACPEPVEWVGGQIPVYPAVSNWGWHCWRDIKRFLIAHPVDVLHIQYQAAAFDLGGWVNWLPWYLRRWNECPKIVTTFHDLRIPYLFPKAGGLRRRTMLALARRSDAVICTNIEDAAVLRGYYWGTHIHHIPLGNNVPVNPPKDYDRRAWRQKLGFNDDALILAYFGFLNESKGGEDLIGVLDELVQSGFNARLLMIGGDVGDSDPSNADYARRVRHKIAERGLSERIVSTGYVDLPEVSANLLAADVAAMPYRDGVSFRRTTLIAALRHGLPTVSTLPAVPLSQIIPGENMLLVSPGDVATLADEIIRVVDNAKLYKHLKEGAKALGMQFDWTKIAAQTAKIYEGRK